MTLALATKLYDILLIQPSVTPGQWLDAATRLEIAATDVGHPDHRRKLRDRADDCRARAIAASRLRVTADFVAPDGSVRLTRQVAS